MEQKNWYSGLSKNTFLLTFASLFADISTEMLYPILPIFLTQNLKVGGSIIGIVEGIAVATQNIIQGFSGWLADKFQKRKSVALFGYLLAALAKPLIGLSTIWTEVLGARFLDRLGSGIRSAPRDALVAQSAEENARGKAFGLEGIGDNTGAFLGPILAVILLYYFKVDIKNIFYLAIIPGLLAVLMVFFVKEKIVLEKNKTQIKLNWASFPSNYWKYLVVTGVFGLGNSSNSFLILQSKSIGMSLETTILIYAVFNLAAAVISYPSGFLSDKLGRKNILLFSFFIFILTYLGFALSQNFILIGLLFILYGFFQGTYRAVGKAFATDFVTANLRASGVGFYSTIVGLSSLFASLVAGVLWDKVSHPAVFLFGAFFAILGSLALLVFF